MKQPWQIILVVILGLSSCCSNDKNCPYGSVTDYPYVPYKTSQVVEFVGPLNRKIWLVFNDKYEPSSPYKIDGSCATADKNSQCYSSLSLSASVFDTTGAIPSSSYRGFRIYLSHSENTSYENSYSLNAFQSIYFNIEDYGDGNITYGTRTQNGYSTPYHTYGKVYVLTGDFSSNYISSKYVIDSIGRLISFAPASDSTFLFHLKE